MTDLERVIVTCNYSPWSRYSGGGQRSAHALGSAFAELGLETHVVFTKPRWERTAPPEAVPYQLHWADFAGLRADGKNPLRALNVLTVARKAAEILADAKKPTALHAQGEEGALLHRLGNRLTCFVQTPRDSALHDPVAQRTGGKVWVRPKFIALRHAVRNADRVCPTSQSSAAQIERMFDVPRKNITVVPNGVHDAFMQVTRATVGPDAPLVYAGRLSRSKGVYELLDAWIDLGASPALWMVGTGPEEQALRARAASAGVGEKIRWLGWCTPEQTASAMAEARAVVLPSYEESFGNVMVEAMASGAPLVTTRTGSIPEVVGEPTRVWWANARDAADLTRTLDACLQAPALAEERAKRAQGFARATYGWKATARRYLDVYRAALGM